MNRLIIIFSFLACVLVLGCEEKSQEMSRTDAVLTASGENIVRKLDLSVSEEPEHIEIASNIQELLELLYKRKQFNGAVLVAEKGKIIYEGAVGEAKFHPTKVSLSVNTPFHLASVSKQFTAMAVMILKERGKLNYDDPVENYIPNLPYRGITIRQLLQHTSGVPKITEYVPLFLSMWDSCKYARNQDLTDILSVYKPGVQFFPGRRFSYNNTGYILLASIVEKASGMSFDKFIEKNIFKPLKMDDSFVYDVENLNKTQLRAFGYGVYRSWYSPDEDDIRNGLLGEKGVYSSVIDLYKWDQALYSEKLVKMETLQEAFTRGQLMDGRQFDYGFGWRMPKKEQNIVYHFGHWRGFRTAIIRIMDKEYTIIILNNTGSRYVKYIALQIIDMLYKEEEGKPDL